MLDSFDALSYNTVITLVYICILTPLRGKKLNLMLLLMIELLLLKKSAYV